MQSDNSKLIFFGVLTIIFLLLIFVYAWYTSPMFRLWISNVFSIQNYTINPTNTKNINYSSNTFPIKHIIIIFQENHAFDNYFGTYPGALGINFSICMPYNPSNLSKGCLKPWLNTNAVDPGAEHSWKSSHAAYDNGLMNGFLIGNKNVPSVMSYYDNKTIPYYWQYAQHYVLTDHLYSSVLSYSQPNHWYEIAGRSPIISFFEGFCGKQGPNPKALYEFCNGVVTATGQQYIDQAQSITTLADALQKKNISWTYYSGSGGNQIKVPWLKASNSVQAFDYWNPLLAQQRSYSTAYDSHIKNTKQILNDINFGTLSNVSWVSPPFPVSEHPPANITIGMWYVTDVVDSVMQSKYWNNTVIIVMWDDYGGYYDGVAPPQVDNYGLSFRVPGIIISPYSKQGYIDHSNYSFESSMKFIENIYGIKNLTNRDSINSPIGNFSNAFNFNQSPQKPYIIHLNSTQKNEVNKEITNSGTGFDQNGNIIVNGYLVNASDFDT